MLVEVGQLDLLAAPVRLWAGEGAGGAALLVSSQPRQQPPLPAPLAPAVSTVDTGGSSPGPSRSSGAPPALSGRPPDCWCCPPAAAWSVQCIEMDRIPWQAYLQVGQCSTRPRQERHRMWPAGQEGMGSSRGMQKHTGHSTTDSRSPSWPCTCTVHISS